MPAPSVPTLAVRDSSAVERGACRCREAFNLAPIAFGDGVLTYDHSFGQRMGKSPLLPDSQVHPPRCRFHIENLRRILRVAGRLFSSSMSRPTWSRSTLKVCLPAVARPSTERGRGEPVAATLVPLLAIERCADALPPLPRSQVAAPRVSTARKSSRTFWKQQIHDYMKAAEILGGTAGECARVAGFCRGQDGSRRGPGGRGRRPGGGVFWVALLVHMF